ncbi:outer membrane protein assembly factor BamB family protein [Pilimelia anulata]|nr:PQQ-binding-like beta-propeller repeat protein [Pilimelia anulata]
MGAVGRGTAGAFGVRAGRIGRRALLAVPLAALAAAPARAAPPAGDGAGSRAAAAAGRAGAAARRRAGPVAELWAIPRPEVVYRMVADGRRLYVLDPAALTCHDVATGAPVWSVPSVPSQSERHLAIAADALAVSVTPNPPGGGGQGDLALRDAATGAQRWRLRLDPDVNKIVADPAGLVVGRGYSTGSATGHALADGAARWTHPLPLCGPAAAGAVPVGDPRNTLLLDVATGERRWRIRPGRFGVLATSPDGAWWTGYGDADGTPPAARRVDGATGRTRWRRPEKLWAAADDGTVVVGLAFGEGLYGFAPDDGATRWHLPGIGGASNSGSLALAAGLVWTSTATGFALTDAGTGAALDPPATVAWPVTTLLDAGGVAVLLDRTHLRAFRRTDAPPASADAPPGSPASAPPGAPADGGAPTRRPA